MPDRRNLFNKVWDAHAVGELAAPGRVGQGRLCGRRPTRLRPLLQSRPQRRAGARKTSLVPHDDSCNADFDPRKKVPQL